MASARPPIVDILNCFGAGGHNVGQLVTYADGSQNAFGDSSFIRAAAKRHRIPITPGLTSALERCDRDFTGAGIKRAAGPSSRTSRKTSRKV